MNYQTKSVSLDLAKVNEDGTFSGYGSVYSVVDQGGDLVEPGAFSKSLKKWNESGRVVPTLWQHRSGEPIGAWVDLKEDDSGLLGKSELWLEDSPYARIAYKGMKTKTITGLSIGYRVMRETFDRKTEVNHLHELELVEISVVTNPMNDAARVDTVKAKLLMGEKPSLREFEEFLREKGFSRLEAERVAEFGFQKGLARECATLSEILSAVKI